MELKLDLHVHSIYSPDSFNSIDDINRRIKEQGFDGYALADHDTIKGLEEAQEKSGDLVLVPAMEISARRAHVVALDPSEVIPSGLGLAETVDLIHDQGAMAILAHPYGLPRSWPQMNQVEASGLDAIEVANSAQVPYGFICNLNQKLADRLGLPATGGSDSHIPETVGRAFTIVESDSADYLDVIKAIRLGHTRVGGSSTKFGEWFAKNVQKSLS